MKDCELIQLFASNLICNFECDNKNLNDFFFNDALDYENQLLGKTLFFKETLNGKLCVPLRYQMIALDWKI